MSPRTRLISDAEYEARLQAQGGTCALCPATPKTRRLDVDHDHKTGEIRGLLCHRCNRALPAWVTFAWLGRAQSYVLDPASHIAMTAARNAASNVRPDSQHDNERSNDA